jgi:hypothetical protein
VRLLADPADPVHDRPSPRARQPGLPTQSPGHSCDETSGKQPSGAVGDDAAAATRWLRSPSCARLPRSEIRGWRGEQPLWKVFWCYGVLAGGSFYVLYALALHDGHIGLQQALLPCIAGYSFWMLVSLWRSSESMTGTLWGALARQAAVAWAGNTILFLIFLQLALIGRYAAWIG